MVTTPWFAEPTANDTVGIYEFFSYVNTSARGLFFPITLLGIWAIAFITLLFSGNQERPSAMKSWIFASFLTTILSIPLTILDLLNSNYMYLSILLLGIGVVWAIVTGNE